MKTAKAAIFREYRSMRQRAILLAAFLTAVSLVAVSQAARAEPAGEPAGWAGDKTVLMTLWRIETEYDTAFKSRLAATGARVKIVTLSGEGSRDTLATKLRGLKADITAGKFDAIYSWGTTATDVVIGLTDNRVPVIFNVVFDPVDSKLVASDAVPGGSVTGVSNGVPIEDQFDAFSSLFPIQTLCLLFNAREHNANIILDRVTGWSERHKVHLTALRTAPDTPFLAEHLARIKSGQIACDAVYAGADSYLGSKATEIRAAIGDHVKLLAGTERFVSFGWLAAFAPEVEDMGSAAADLMIRVLSGEKPGTIPVVRPEPKLFISEDAAARHGVTIPAGAVKKKSDGSS